MKPIIKTSVIVILLSGTAIHLTSFTKEATLPRVATFPVTNITQTSALVDVKLSDEGGANVSEMDIYWSTIDIL